MYRVKHFVFPPGGARSVVALLQGCFTRNILKRSSRTRLLASLLVLHSFLQLKSISEGFHP